MPDSATSIVRDHSPYCEATGPIVQEGFVAARIRAFQGLQDGAEPRRSHLPMIPCPVPKWLQIYEPVTPPRSIRTFSLSTSDRRRADVKGSQGTAPIPWKSKPSPLHGRTLHDEQCDTMKEVSVCSDLVIDDKMILSPQAIAPSLAQTSGTWALPPRRHDQDCNGGGSIPCLRPQRSIADKLGSLVDRGWQGGDMSERKTDDQQASNDHTPGLCPHGRKSPRKSQVCNEASFEGMPRLRRCRSSHESIHVRKQLRRLREEDGLVLEDHGPRFTSYRGEGKRSDCQIEYGDFKKSQGDQSFSEVIEAEFQRIDKTNQSKGKPRAWTLHHPNRSKQCQDQRIQLRALSLSQEIDRHLAEWKEAGIVDTGDAEDRSIEASQSEQTTRPSFEPLRTQSSRPSSVTTQRSKQSGTRSSSLIARLGGYKLLLVDKAPTARGLSGNVREPTMNTTETQHHLEDARGQKSLATGDALMLQEKLPNYSGSRSSSHQVEPVLSGIAGDAGSHRTGKDICDKSHVFTDHRASQLPAQLPMTPPKTTMSRREQGKPVPLSGKHYGSSSSHIHMSPVSAQDTSKSFPSRSLSDAVFENGITDFPRRQSPETASYLSRAESTSLPRQSEQGDGSTHDVHWESARSGNGIRRVQVVVSLDGADDLIVEAKLLKKRSTGYDLLQILEGHDGAMKAEGRKAC